LAAEEVLVALKGSLDVVALLKLAAVLVVHTAVVVVEQAKHKQYLVAQDLLEQSALSGLELLAASPQQIRVTYND
jgi:hypothetical protein